MTTPVAPSLAPLPAPLLEPKNAWVLVNACVVPPGPEQTAQIVAGLELERTTDFQLIGTDGPNGKPSWTETQAHRAIAIRSKKHAGIPDDLDVLAYSWPLDRFDAAMVHLAMVDEIVARAIEAEAAKRTAARAG